MMGKKKTSKFTKVEVELESIPKEERKNKPRRNSWAEIYHKNTVRRKSMKLLGEDVIMDEWLDCIKFFKPCSADPVYLSNGFIKSTKPPTPSAISLLICPITDLKEPTFLGSSFIIEFANLASLKALSLSPLDLAILKAFITSLNSTEAIIINLALHHQEPAE